MREFIIKNITDHLTSLGLEERIAFHCATKGFEYFQSRVSNSRDPFKEACDYSGKIAQEKNSKFKYKSPASRRLARSKKPQEVFKF